MSQSESVSVGTTIGEHNSTTIGAVWWWYAIQTELRGVKKSDV